MIGLLAGLACLSAVSAQNTMELGTCSLVCDHPPLTPTGSTATVAIGSAGPPGPKGDMGPIGPQGPKGEPGENCECPPNDGMTVPMKDISDKLRRIHAPVNCSEVIPRGENQRGGVYTIYPQSWNGTGVKLYCDTTTDGGGWIVFQRRVDGSVDFYRGWNEYVKGFGDLDGEYWLGLKHLHRLMQEGKYELRVDLEDFDGNTTYASYSSFTLGGADAFYPATISGYRGTAGSCLSLNNIPFSTKDQDHDTSSSNCATNYKGAMWYTNCHCANLNGQYLKGAHESYANGVNWNNWRGYHYSLKFTEMKIRKVD